MLQPIEFGAEYLQGRIDREIVLAKHMGIIVEAAHDDGLILRARSRPTELRVLPSAAACNPLRC